MQADKKKKGGGEKKGKEQERHEKTGAFPAQFSSITKQARHVNFAAQ